MRTFCTDFYNKFMGNIQLGSRTDTNQTRLDRKRIEDSKNTPKNVRVYNANNNLLILREQEVIRCTYD